MDDGQAEEIARIGHELTALRSIYALMERRARTLKLFCQVVVVPVVTAILVYLLVTHFVAGLFAIIMSGAISSLVWFCRSADARRWIDFAVPQDQVSLGPSYAKKVETWIAERESRLAQMKKYDPVDRNPPA